MAATQNPFALLRAQIAEVVDATFNSESATIMNCASDSKASQLLLYSKTTILGDSIHWLDAGLASQAPELVAALAATHLQIHHAGKSLSKGQQAAGS